MTTQPRDLMLIDRARQALAEAQSLDEVVDLRDKAAALGAYLKRRDGAEEAAGHALEIRVRAERKTGEMLRARKKHPGGRPNWLQPATSLPATLEELGVEKTQALRWQRIASIPEEKFESEIQERTLAGDLSTSQMVRFARDVKTEAKRDLQTREEDARSMKLWGGQTAELTPQSIEQAKSAHLEYRARREAEEQAAAIRRLPVTALLAKWTDFHNEFHRAVVCIQTEQECDDLRDVLCELQDSLVVFEELFRERDDRFGVEPHLVKIREQERERGADRIRFEARVS